MNVQLQEPGAQQSTFGAKIPLWIKAVVIGLLVNSLAVGVWPVLGLQLPVPLAFGIMTFFLFLYVKYFSGSWWPAATQAKRQASFRATKLTRNAWIWGGFGALLLWMNKLAFGAFIFRLFSFPQGAYSETISYFQNLPVAHAVLAIIMTSAVAGIAEETGLRGYLQQPLEKKYGPVVSIAVASLVFTAIHLPQVTNFPYLLVLFVFSAWFGALAYATNSLLPGIIVHALMDTHAFLALTGLLGIDTEVRPTIFESGVDQHFLLSTGVLLVSLVLFILVIKKLLKTHSAL